MDQSMAAHCGYPTEETLTMDTTERNKPWLPWQFFVSLLFGSLLLLLLLLYGVADVERIVDVVTVTHTAVTIGNLTSE